MDPALEDIAGVTIYSIDNLSKTLKNNEARRQNEVKSVKGIVSDIQSDYTDWYTMQTVVPIIKDVKIGIHNLSLRMLDSHLPKLGDLSLAQKQSIELLLENLSDKTMHNTMSNLQQIQESTELKHAAETLKKRFVLTSKIRNID